MKTVNRREGDMMGMRPWGTVSWRAFTSVDEERGGRAQTTRGSWASRAWGALAAASLVASPVTAANIAVLSNQNETDVATDFNTNVAGHTFTGINVQSTTPTLASLLAYDAVLLFENGIFANAPNVGNRLEEYANTGRAVVLGTFYEQDRSDSPFNGNWARSRVSTRTPPMAWAVHTPSAT